MGRKRWAGLAIFFFLFILGYKITQNPFAPDVGTPGFIVPDNPIPVNMSQAKIPEGGLVKNELMENRFLHLPPGFEIKVYSSGLGGARLMALDKNGDLFLSQTKKGRISVLQDLDNDGMSDGITVFIDGLNQPHGIAFKGDWLYVAENDRVVRIKDSDNDLRADLMETIIENLPSGGIHFTRTIGFGPDGNLYISVGSSCNVCEDDPRRAAILQYDKKGGSEKVYASGLRNSVGFVWNKNTGEMHATDNGRDLLGDDIPPDEVNIIRDGGHYGWPYCLGQNIPDPKYGDDSRCMDKEPPLVEFQAHSAPLGLRFYDEREFPERYEGNLFVAYHGSWNRREPTGYKVVSINFDEATPRVEDFIIGWLTEDGEKWGRPVDILFDEGGMFISDDFSGTVYKVEYMG